MTKREMLNVNPYKGNLYARFNERESAWVAMSRCGSLLCKHILIVASTLFTVLAAVAVPTVSNVNFSQNEDTRVITVTYELSEEAVIVVDFQTNVADNVWTSIGYANMHNVAGDVWKLMPASGKNDQHVITWQPVESWPNMKGTMRAVVSIITF